MKSLWKPTEKHDVNRLLALFRYAEALSFKVIWSHYFKIFLKGATNFGKGYSFPAFELVRGSLLGKEVQVVSHKLKEKKKIWSTTDCSIWTDILTPPEYFDTMSLSTNVQKFH